MALHDLEVENIVAGKRKLEDNKPLYPGLIRKIRNQTLKDYLLFPALTGPLFPLTLAGNATANLVRNIWAFNIIFCGHFPAGVATFSQEECEDENRGHWYYRQLLGSANITGGKLFHLMSGNLSLPDRAPPVPGPAGPALPGARRRGPRDLRALRPARTTPAGCPSSCSAWPSKICRMALPDRKPKQTGPAPVTEDALAA